MLLLSIRHFVRATMLFLFTLPNVVNVNSARAARLTFVALVRIIHPTVTKQ